MSEKRFEFYSDEDLIGVLDTVTGKTFNSFEIVGLLNKLVKDNEELGISIKLFEDDIATKDKKIDEQQSTITELKSIINFASNGEDLIVLLMKEIIKLRQEVQECQAYETIEKGVSNYD